MKYYRAIVAIGKGFGILRYVAFMISRGKFMWTDWRDTLHPKPIRFIHAIYDQCESALQSTKYKKMYWSLDEKLDVTIAKLTLIEKEFVLLKYKYFSLEESQSLLKLRLQLSVYFED